jgi:hypothetical protein
MAAKNWTGQKLHHLTFTTRHPEKKAGHVMWNALCECGQETVVLPHNVVIGRTTSCGCKRSEYYKLPHRKYTPAISSARAVWQGHYSECDFDTFLALSQQPCHYCRRLPFRTYNIAKRDIGYRTFSENQFQNGSFTYNGLDRVDSAQGHTPDNVVACCWDCNSAKMDRTMEEFLAHIVRMYEGTRHLRDAKDIG